MSQLIPFYLSVPDGRWTLAVALVAAAAYRGAMAAGLGEAKAATYAEAAGYKELYKGLLYPEEIEKGLAQIRSRAGTS